MTTTTAKALQQLRQHPAWDARACTGREDLFHSPDLGLGPDGHEQLEPQRARVVRERAAKALCRACPVVEACAEYGLREPHGIWGGMTAGERARERRLRALGAAAGGEWRPTTEQQRRVLAAVAQYGPGRQPELITAEQMVCAATGLDARTVRWQIASIATLLGLDKDRATRAEWLAAARRTGALPPAPARARRPRPGAAGAAPGTPVQRALFPLRAISTGRAAAAVLSWAAAA